MIIFTPMNTAFYKLIEESTAHRLNREFIRDYVIEIQKNQNFQ